MWVAMLDRSGFQSRPRRRRGIDPLGGDVVEVGVVVVVVVHKGRALLTAVQDGAVEVVISEDVELGELADVVVVVVVVVLDQNNNKKTKLMSLMVVDSNSFRVCCGRYFGLELSPSKTYLDI